jgi:hypothetical protein
MKKVGIGVLIVLGVGLLIWLNYALFAGKILGLTPEVRAALQSDGEVTVALLEDDSWLVMIPGKAAPTTGLILYPEGHMDVRSYALVSREIARQGFQVVFLSRRLETEYSEAEEQQRIEAVMSAYPQIERWVVGGHTWGGQVGVDADAAATISSESQQAQAVAATVEFLSGLSE